MGRDEIDAAKERLGEQIMSDERILGVLPEDSARVLLDWALARLDATAAEAPDLETFESAGESLRQEVRAAADDAAARDEDAAALAARLGVSQSGAGEPAASEEGVAAIDGATSESGLAAEERATLAEPVASEPSAEAEPATVWDEQPPFGPDAGIAAEVSAVSGVEPADAGVATTESAGDLGHPSPEAAHAEGSDAPENAHGPVVMDESPVDEVVAASEEAASRGEEGSVERFIEGMGERLRGWFRRGGEGE